MLGSRVVVFPRQRMVTLFTILLLTLGLAATAAAQGERGVIGGTVADAQGGVLPGVTISVRNTATGFTQTAVTEADGKYRFGALPLGSYELKAELTGFTTATVTNLTLSINQELQQNLTMNLSSLQESVTVTGQAPVVEVTKSEVAATITQNQIEMLPVASRQAVTLALLLPGTSQDGTRPRRSNAQVGAGTLQFTTTNLADGTMNMSTKAGEPRQDFPASAIQEFKVFTTQPPAEYGGRAGGVINVVTKSGTNSFSGEGYEYFRNKDTINRVDEFTQAAIDAGLGVNQYDRNQFGGALGGPIIRNHAHFFVAAEDTRENTSYLVHTGQPQDYGTYEGVFDNKDPVYEWLIRADGQLTSKQNGFIRYAKERQELVCEGCGGTKANGGNTLIPRDALVMGHTWVLGQKFLNDFRFNYAQQFQHQEPTGQPYYTNLDFAPARFVGLTPIYNFPSYSFGNDTIFNFHNMIREWRDDFSISESKHTFKFGADIQNLPVNEDVGGDPEGTWTFGKDQPFNYNDPAIMAGLTGATKFTASFPGLLRYQPEHYFQYYAQDEWRIANGVTLNLGLRYEYNTLIWNEGRKNDGTYYPLVLPNVNFASRGDKNNWSPRLGLAWDVANNGKNVVRAGYGRLFNTIMNGTMDGEDSTLLQTSISISNPSYPDPYQGRSPASFASTAPPNISTVSDNMVNPWSDMYNAGYSRQLGQDMAINVDGTYTKSNGFNASVNVNSPDPVTGLRPLPQWGQINQVQSIGWQKYEALLVRVEKRLSHRYQYTVSYALTKDTDNSFSGTSTGSITDFYHQSEDAGYGAADRRHAVAVSGAYLAPGDVTIGLVWTARTSQPFSARAGKDLNGDGATTDYVPGTTKGQGCRGLDFNLVNAYRAANNMAAITQSPFACDPYNRVDLRASKSIKLGGARQLQLIGQIFNVFGTNNLGGIGSSFQTNALSPVFGQWLTAQPRQQGEVAIRMTF